MVKANVVVVSGKGALSLHLRDACVTAGFEKYSTNFRDKERISYFLCSLSSSNYTFYVLHNILIIKEIGENSKTVTK